MSNFSKPRNPGMMVEHLKTGKKGRTYNNKEMINGKVPVYFEMEDAKAYETKAILCSTENLKVVGFID